MPEAKRTIMIETMGGVNYFEVDHEHWLKIKRALWSRQSFSVITEEHGEYFYRFVASAHYSDKNLAAIPRVKAILLQRPEG